MSLHGSGAAGNSSSRDSLAVALAWPGLDTQHLHYNPAREPTIAPRDIQTQGGGGEGEVQHRTHLGR